MAEIETAQRDDVQQVALQINQVIGKLWQWHSGDFCPTDTWSPPINLYRLARRIDVCVDLAGVDRSKVEVRVQPGVLIIKGVRHAPEPPKLAKPRPGDDQAMRIITMEIDHGPFCRTIRLPDQVDLLRIESEYVDGMLWVRLPLREPG